MDKDRVFVDSNNSNRVINVKGSLLLKVPFPPVIDPHDLVKIRNGRVPNRTPNAFLIYRKMFIETAKNGGHYLPMTVISPIASQSWEQENDVVKTEYKRLAKEVYKVRNEMLNKSQPKRKRGKWNTISFVKKGSTLKIQQEPTVTKIINSSTSDLQFISSNLQSESIHEINSEIEQFRPNYSNFIHYTPNANVLSPEILSISSIDNRPRTFSTVEKSPKKDLIDYNNDQLLISDQATDISNIHPFAEIDPQYEFNYLESSLFSEPPLNTNGFPIITEELFDFINTNQLGFTETFPNF